MISLESNGVRMVKWRCKVMPEDSISVVKLRNRLQYEYQGGMYV